jgi:tudor domain-containing protein 3
LDSNKDKENKENAEFEAQRKDAIAEAARGGAKKVFGGGNKPVSG